MPAHSTASALAEQLRGDIDAGAWKAGAPLRQDQLATRYGASRIPVREALQLLRSEGIVIIEPNRGAYVATLSADAVNEIFDLRLMLECQLLISAVHRHDDMSLVRLEAAQNELELQRQRVGWLASDRRFHLALYKPAALTLTLNIMLTLRAQVERYMPQEIGPDTRRKGWDDEHRTLIALVRKKDVAGAHATLVKHLNETRAAVIRHMDQSK